MAVLSVSYLLFFLEFYFVRMLPKYYFPFSFIQLLNHERYVSWSHAIGSFYVWIIFYTLVVRFYFNVINAVLVKKKKVNVSSSFISKIIFMWFPKKSLLWHLSVFTGPHADTASGCQNLQCGFRACCRSGEWPLTSGFCLLHLAEQASFHALYL